MDRVLRLSVVASHLLLAGCVGFATVAESTRGYGDPGFVGKKPGTMWNDGDEVVRAQTKRDVLSLWGEPASRESTGSVERWAYKRELGWSGLIVFLIVPVPLMVPVGYRPTIATFEGDKLVLVEQRIGDMPYAAACGVVPTMGGWDFGCKRWP